MAIKKMAMVAVVLVFAFHEMFATTKIHEMQLLINDYPAAVNDTITGIYPEYQGGMTAFLEELRNELKYPKKARKAKIDGQVVLEFVINEEGAIVEPNVIYSLSTECDKEAIRALMKMPAWKPAIKDGKPVRSYMILPIRFSLIKQKK